MSAADEVLVACQQLLAAIDRQDWETYASLCDSTLTAFEPEAAGHLVTGMDFHHYYFPPKSEPSKRQSNIASPNVRVVGDCAVVAYTRLTQSVDPLGEFHVSASNETRVWHKQGERWKHIHFHRSPCNAG